MAAPRYYIKSNLPGTKTLLLTVDPYDKLIIEDAPSAPAGNQVWTKKDSGDGAYNLVSNQGAKKIKMGETNEQATVIKIGGSSLQFPTPTGAGTGVVNIQDANTKLVLAISAASPVTTGTPVVCVPPATNNKNQEWKFESAS